MDDTTPTTGITEDVASGDLGGSQDLMRGSPRPQNHRLALVTYQDHHGMNLGSAERALDLFGGDGDDNGNKDAPTDAGNDDE